MEKEHEQDKRNPSSPRASLNAGYSMQYPSLRKIREGWIHQDRVALMGGGSQGDLSGVKSINRVSGQMHAELDPSW